MQYFARCCEKARISCSFLYYRNLRAGVTGFVGSTVLEQLLRVCPSVKRVYVVIREKRGHDRCEPSGCGRYFRQLKLFKGVVQLVPNEEAVCLLEIISRRALQRSRPPSERQMACCPFDLESLPGVRSTWSHTAAYMPFKASKSPPWHKHDPQLGLLIKGPVGAEQARQTRSNQEEPAAFVIAGRNESRVSSRLCGQDTAGASAMHER